jgi:Reverse transcriptase (RNA-dependent DNA polymerase)
MFLKQTRTGKIKDKGCADGRKQRHYDNQLDSSSPTVAIKSVMLTSMIEASENCDVATVDIPCAFLQADMDEIVYVKISGKMVDILVQRDSAKYNKFIVSEKNKRCIYVQLKKTLYITLHAALLFWKMLTAQLQE